MATLKSIDQRTAQPSVIANTKKVFMAILVAIQKARKRIFNWVLILNIKGIPFKYDAYGKSSLSEENKICNWMKKYYKNFHYNRDQIWRNFGTRLISSLCVQWASFSLTHPKPLFKSEYHHHMCVVGVSSAIHSKFRFKIICFWFIINKILGFDPSLSCLPFFISYFYLRTRKWARTGFFFRRKDLRRKERSLNDCWTIFKISHLEVEVDPPTPARKEPQGPHPF